MANISLSVITVSFNNADGLLKTLKSIDYQTVKPDEVIVIDGGSKDNSINIIRQFDNIVTYWCSESDRGIYHAMNKGVAVAKGDYCIFMNSGDIFIDNEVISRFITENAIEDVLCGNILFRVKDKPIKYIEAPRTPNLFFFLTASLPHQAAFIRTSKLVEEPYQEEYNIVADFVFFFDLLFLKGGTYRKVDFFVASGDMGGISHTRMDALWEEKNRYLDTVLPIGVRRDLEPYVWEFKEVWGYPRTNIWFKLIKTTQSICFYLISLLNKIRRKQHLFSLTRNKKFV